MEVAVVAMVLLSLGLLWAMQSMGRSLSHKFGGSRRRAREQARKHFVAAAQLVSRARRSNSNKLAKEAAAACDKAIAFDPHDAASHIIKALALEQLGHKSAAIRSLNTALSPPASKSLSDSERADALFKRATMFSNPSSSSSSSSRRANVSAIADLEECMALNPRLTSKAMPIKAACCRSLGMEVPESS